MEHNEDKIIYEYCIVRYVPDIERGEFINVGILMVCKKLKWLRSAIMLNSNKMSLLNSRHNLEFLKNQFGLFERKDVPSSDLPVEEKYRWLAAVKSSIIQTSPSHPGVIYYEKNNPRELLENKFDELFSKLIG